MCAEITERSGRAVGLDLDARRAGVASAEPNLLAAVIDLAVHALLALRAQVGLGQRRAELRTDGIRAVHAQQRRGPLCGRDRGCTRNRRAAAFGAARTRRA